MTLRTPALILLLATLMLPLGSAADPTAHVGVTGTCYDSDPRSDGGEDQVLVDGTTPTPPTVFGALAAVTAFATGPGDPASGDGCASSADDHVEAHAYVDTGGALGKIGAEACYAGSTAVADVTSGDCYMNSH